MSRSQITQRDNFFYLFAALMTMVVSGPVLAALLGDVGVFVAEASLSGTLVLALWSLHSSRLVFNTGIALVVINVLAMGIWLMLGSDSAGLLAKLSGLAFLIISTIVAARQVFRRDRVDLNKIVGALCIYLLIGAVWAIFYQLLEDLVPGSFAGVDGHQGYALSWRLLYFSFVTLTTLGYGDVLPLTVYAESLVLLEAILGQFYLAVLVAGLISAYLSDRDIHNDTNARSQSGVAPDLENSPTKITQTRG